MFCYLWPLGLIVLSNTLYQICTKSSPEKMNPFATLTVTYAVGAVMSLILYHLLPHEGSLLGEYRKLNFAPVLLGLVIVGLESGYIYGYKAGWSVVTLPIVQAAAVAICCIFVGYFLYKEGITWNKIVGVAVCLGGMFLINMKT